MKYRKADQDQAGRDKGNPSKSLTQASHDALPVPHLCSFRPDAQLQVLPAARGRNLLGFPCMFQELSTAPLLARQLFNKQSCRDSKEQEA
jgi:hypothetical protein